MAKLPSARVYRPVKVWSEGIQLGERDRCADPNKTFAVKAIATPPASDVVSTYTFEQEGSGTKLHISMDAAVMPGTEGMVIPQLRAALDTSLVAFKKAIEG